MLLLILMKIEQAWLQAIIDFGLTYHSSIHEDKAVDLYVLERAVTSMITSETHVVCRTSHRHSYSLIASFKVHNTVLEHL